MQRSTTKFELQLGFWLLILDHIHHLKTGVFRLSFFGKCFKDHWAWSLPVLLNFDQILGSWKIFCSFSQMIRLLICRCCWYHRGDGLWLISINYTACLFRINTKRASGAFFCKELDGQQKGIGHLIDFMLDRWKASGGSIRIAIFEDACLGLVQR